MGITSRDKTPRARVVVAFSALLAVMTVVLAAIGCATNPVTGRHELSLVSSDEEARIGREGMGAVVAEYGVYDDTRLKAYVDSVGHRLAAVSHLPQLEWHFTLLDDPTVNAFAMPGGYIYITRGILAHLNSEAQLAGVMGHEIGHVTARHAARQMTQQQLAGLGLGLAQAFSTTFRQYSPAAQQALGLLMLKYSRDDETQADELGVEYATKAGWDPRVIPSTYEMLGRISDKSGQRLPGYLSTHPDPGDRQTRTTQLSAAAAAGKTGLIVNGRSYLERLDGLVFGNDPRNGYIDGDVLVEPRNGFELRLPPGWKRQSTQQSLMSANPAQTAGFEASLGVGDNRSPGERIAALQQAGRISAASGRDETLGGYAAWVGAVIVPGDAGPERMLVTLARLSDTSMLQITGRSAAADDDDERAILTCMRSVRPIESAHAHPEVMRVAVPKVTSAGSFQSVVGGLGTQAIDLDDTAILNDRYPDQPVLAGELIKVVRKH
ncbi:MAG: M48 family metalloprotease [Candidatus Eisenbacteria bacterium]